MLYVEWSENVSKSGDPLQKAKYKIQNTKCKMQNTTQRDKLQKNPKINLPDLFLRTPPRRDLFCLISRPYQDYTFSCLRHWDTIKLYDRD
jgi:hypothetical protein